VLAQIRFPLETGGKAYKIKLALLLCLRPHFPVYAAFPISQEAAAGGKGVYSTQPEFLNF
jgi:hypothetical protein